MAHRAIFAVTFTAAGLWLAACGGGDGTAGDAGDEFGSDQPPASADQAPGSADQPPGNSDQPPANPDQPPGNPDQLPGAGSGAGDNRTPCKKLCAQYAAACPGPGINQIVRQICSDDCAQADAVPACAQTVASAVDCVSKISGLCMEPAPAGESCASSINSALDCVGE